MSLILFEDEHLLVINKPAGWNTHAPGPYAGEGVYDWLKHREPRWSKLAIIHRLDKETSGVMVFGKTPEANRSLTEQFAHRGVRKRYLLLSDRNLPQKEFTAVSTITRAGDKYVSQPLRPNGERAETRFKLLSVEQGKSLIQAEPVTGRTHQIRVHAAAHGFPILGDTLYGGTKAQRVCLHAAELSLRHPATESPTTFCAPCDWSADRRVHADMAVRAPDALQRAMIDAGQTDSFRLIHGASDGWNGLYVDRLGEFLLAQSEGALSTAQRELLETLARQHGARGVYHKRLNANVRRADAAESSPQLVFGSPAPERFTIRENGLVFELSFNEGYSVGLFLDQRDNRCRWLVNYIAPEFFLSHAHPPKSKSDSELCALAPLREMSVLNTFAYTCGFSVAAAKAGARTTSLDLSKKYLEWGQRNFALNQLDPAQHDFIYGDAFDWMRRLAKKNRLFDVIALDPPTFSQSKESGVWQAEKHYGKLVEAALPLLKRDGVLFASTNAAKLEPERFLGAIHAAVEKTKRKVLHQHYVPQPPDFPISRAEPAYLKTVWTRVG
jgi:23S rRNA (cytosine1962-C5)-methyltransferase